MLEKSAWNFEWIIFLLVPIVNTILRRFCIPNAGTNCLWLSSYAYIDTNVRRASNNIIERRYVSSYVRIRTWDFPWFQVIRSTMRSRRCAASLAPVHLIIALCLMGVCDCFNIDVRHPVIHRSTPNSLFGYSIDFYQYQGMTLQVFNCPFMPFLFFLTHSFLLIVHEKMGLLVMLQHLSPILLRHHSLPFLFHN